MSQLEEENENHSNQRSRTVMSEFMMVRKKLIADSLDRIEMRTRKNGIVPPYSSKGSAREMEICMQQMGCLRDGTLYLLITFS